MSLSSLAADPPDVQLPQAVVASAQPQPAGSEPRASATQPMASVQAQQAAAGTAAGGAQPGEAASVASLQAAQAAQALEAQQLAAGAQVARPLGWEHGSYAQIISPRLSSPGGTASGISTLGR